MNRVEACRILNEQLSPYAALAYSELVCLVGEETSSIQRGYDGAEYAVSFSVRWRDVSGGDLVVRGSISLAAWGSPHDRVDEFVVVVDSATG